MTALATSGAPPHVVEQEEDVIRWTTNALFVGTLLVHVNVNFDSIIFDWSKAELIR